MVHFIWESTVLSESDPVQDQNVRGPVPMEVQEDSLEDGSQRAYGSVPEEASVQAGSVSQKERWQWQCWRA